MKLTDPAILPKTVEQVIHDVYAYDAATQVRVMNAVDAQVVHFSHTQTIEVPIALAREALMTYQGPNMVISEEEARLIRAQRAFNQNPTPAMATIIKRLARRVMERRRGKP